MTCTWYERQLANDAVDLWPSGRPSPALLDHARTCPTCDRILQRELALKLRLLDLAQKHQTLTPSPSVKSNLLAELDSLHPVPVPSPTRIWFYALAAAAIICLAVALVIARRPSAPPSTIANRPVAKPEPIAPKTTPAPEPTAVAEHRAPTPRRAPAPQTHSDFYPVVMCDSVTCAGPALTVRVQLPRSPLAARGSNTPVMADLLVGEDGLVRGVRLLQ